MAKASVIASGDAAYGRLRHAIVRLELPPGTPVSEQRLMERYGVSKAAVRAALARLRADGLVLAEPRRRHVIAPLTLRDVREIYDLRLLLEPAAAAEAAGRLEPAELVRLEQLGATTLDIEDPDSMERFMAANRAVHVAVAEAAGNGRAAADRRAAARRLRAGAAGGTPCRGRRSGPACAR